MWQNGATTETHNKMKADYFKTAIKAAVKAIKETGDYSRAHRIASEICEEANPGAPAQLWTGLGWQAVLAAQGRLAVVRG
jgi:hypothetical protein